MFLCSGKYHFGNDSLTVWTFDVWRSSRCNRASIHEASATAENNDRHEKVPVVSSPLASLAGTFAPADFCIESPNDLTIDILFRRVPRLGSLLLVARVWKYHIDG